MLTRDALLGSWVLESAEVAAGDVVTDPAPFGPSPYGVLHYLADGRMAVIIAHAHRPEIAGGRAGGSDADRLHAAATFQAYAGTFDIAEGIVTHHVEANSFPNDVGVDYVRFADLKGDLLVLTTPPWLPADQRPMRLMWTRFAKR